MAAERGAETGRVRMRMDTLAAGGLAGATARTITAPLDRVKILMQTEHLTSGGGPSKYTGLVQSLRRVLMEEGAKGYFRGNMVNCIRVFPYSATQFVTFDYMKRSVCAYTGEKQPSVPQRLACGAIAGCAASFVTHPLDVLRTRLAVQPELRGIAHALGSVWQEGGVMGLYKGLGPALVSLGPFVAINFASYDTIKSTFGKENQVALRTITK
jgi:solute carrier family 25 phosphate transporter 23/24/25/41